MKKIILFFGIIIFFGNCKAQTINQKMISTSKAILNSIKDSNEKKFESLIGNKLSTISKDQERINADFENLVKYYHRYLKEGEPSLNILNGYNVLGNKEVEVVIFEGKDSINNITLVKLGLFFGPPKYVPLDKIANYEITINIDHITPPIAPPRIK